MLLASLFKIFREAVPSGPYCEVRLINLKLWHMKLLAALAGGLAGAITVTILHELTRKLDPTAPRLDLVGESATQKLAQKAGYKPPTGNSLYAGSLAGSILTNALSYSLAGMSGKRPLSLGTIVGAAMGWSALKLPKKLGLRSIHTDGSTKRRWLTMALYITGGLVASAVSRRIEKKRRQKPIVSPYKSPDEAWKPVLDIVV
jgi:hypothetical protein